MTRSPEGVAADLVLGVLVPERVPMWAAWWLVDGYDGPHLRELAGLSGRDPRDVRDLLASALADAGVELPAPAEACRIVFRDAATRCLAGELSEERVVELVERLTITRWPGDEVRAQPLGEINGIDDEWGEGWGRPVAELRAVVRDACTRQINR